MLAVGAWGKFNASAATAQIAAAQLVAELLIPLRCSCGPPALCIPNQACNANLLVP